MAEDKDNKRGIDIGPDENGGGDRITFGNEDQEHVKTTRQTPPDRPNREDDGDVRKKLYKEGATLVSRMD